MGSGTTGAGDRGRGMPGGSAPASIRPCKDADVDAVWTIVNAAATAYAGVIPADRYHVPYMPADELRAEIEAGVRFWGWYGAGSRETTPAARGAGGRLVGVMGIQDVDDVTLIRHAYVEPASQGAGVGSALLVRLVELARQPLLVGTWSAATWAIRFYERHGFELVTPAEKDRLLRRYWRIPDRQVETSVVLRLREQPDTSAGEANERRAGRTRTDEART